jgi:DNA-directed RNA polymerase specialized sigma24 family protein
MRQTPPLADQRILPPARTALALELMSEVDLLRLKTIARLYARGLPPDVAWDDLLQEAITRVLVGARKRPAEVGIVAFLAGVMRSLKADHWRRSLRGTDNPHEAQHDAVSDQHSATALPDPAPSPERSLIARQELAAITRLFASDQAALQIIAGLSQGLSPNQIRTAARLSRTDYDSARKRMRRTLLREGLTCEPK